MLENIDFDIILVSEIWFNLIIYEREVLLDNYVFVVRKDCLYSFYGGVVIIIKVNIDVLEIVLDIFIEMVVVLIFFKDNSKFIIVCSIYRFINNDVDYINKMCVILRELYWNYLDYILWIGGDVNIFDINWVCDLVEGYNYLIIIS